MKFNKPICLLLIICLSFFTSCFSIKSRKIRNRSHEVNLAGAEIQTLTYGDKTVKVRFDTTKTANHFNSKPINCFQFSTANPKKDYPGKLVEINDKNLRQALKEEKAIQIVFKNGVAQLEDGAEVNPEKNYYIIGVMWYPGEFHFVRLFKDGWFSKPSKVGQGNWVTREFKLPSEAMGNILAKQSGSRTYKFLGFYLHPNRDEYINKLLE
jgi:hypothetical protein